MSLSSLIFMLLAWATVTALVVFSFAQVWKAPSFEEKEGD